MRYAIISIAILAIPMMLAESIPTLSTADRTALMALEARKATAQKEFNDAQQTELAIEREFATAHAGFHVNPQTFVVEADAKPTAKPIPPAAN